MDVKSASEFVSSVWTATVEPKLCEYIAIPNQSPLFDPEWATNGLQEKVAHLFDDWVESQKVPGLTHKIIEEAGRTPLIFIEVEGTIEGQSKEDQKNNTVLLYGHMDKQPPLTADWDEGLHPYTPVYRDGKLYGRGGADDGYAVFSAVTAINSLKQQGLPHARCVIIIEACEESGSRDLPYYIEKLADEIGTPSLIVCLDSGCGNYDQLWLTSSLRGILVGNLKVRILKEGVHSGKASGIVPSSFRILRQVLSRIEDPETGKMLVPVLDGPGIPESRVSQAHQVAETLGQTLIDEYPFWPGARSVDASLAELLLNKTWRPTLEVTGVAGIPPLNEAGNVLRSYTEVKLSIRLPPNAKSEDIIPVLKEVLEKDPPYGAEVVFTAEKASAGWDSPQLAPWLEGAINKASEQVFGKPACIMGEGGSIPFMGMLGEKFPKAQFVITGVLGPNSNAHGPNEFIEIQTSKNVTTCVGYILHEHSKQPLA